MLKQSFLPADLHVYEVGQGFFVVTLASQEILKTKSESSALGCYLALKRTLEKLLLTPERTAAKKIRLLERAVESFIGRTPAHSVRLKWH